MTSSAKLPDGDLRGHGVEGVPDGRGLRGVGERGDGGAHLGAGQRHEQVAQQYRGAAAVGRGVAEPARGGVLGGVPAVGRGTAAAGQGGVDDVVVDQGAGLVQLERRSEAGGGGAGHEPTALLFRFQLTVIQISDINTFRYITVKFRNGIKKCFCIRVFRLF